MDEIESLLHSPGFWFTAVVIALIVGVLTTYIVRAIDAAGMFVRNRRTARSRAQQHKWDAAVETLRGDLIFQDQVAHRVTWIYLQAILIAVTSMATFALGVFWLFEVAAWYSRNGRSSWLHQAFGLTCATGGVGGLTVAFYAARRVTAIATQLNEAWRKDVTRSADHVAAQSPDPS